MGAGGFEPPKAEPTGLQPVPFGRSGTPPGERDCSLARPGTGPATPGKEQRMKSRSMRRLGVVLVVAVALGTAGGALACDRSGSAKQEAMRTLASHHQRAVFGVVSSYLGLTNAQIVAQLKAGKTLAEIANATPGKSAAGLIDAIVAAVKKSFDRKVAAGRITSAQETKILAAVRDRVTQIVNAHFDQKHRHG